MTAQSQWGTSDWRDEPAYDYVLKLPPELRRWEFLRRLPEYRATWLALGAAGSAFGLKTLLDPALNAIELIELERRPHFLDWQLAGGPLAVPPPQLIDLLDAPLHEQRNALAVHLGTALLNMIDAGYVVFSVDPEKSARTQAARIERWIVEHQRAVRAEASMEAGSPGMSALKSRANSKPFHDSNQLLRVMDAYEAERLTEEPVRRGAKTAIGKAIFGEKKHSTAWHKELTAAFARARRAAYAPLPEASSEKESST